MIDNRDSGLFSNLSQLNKAALAFFLVAKVFGLIGISLGFIGGEYLHIGGFALGMSLISIFSAITCGLVQTSKDKQKFQIEDDAQGKLKKLNEAKARLEKEIEDLEAQKSAVRKFLMSK
jgi:hypothetical protein